MIGFLGSLFVVVSRVGLANFGEVRTLAGGFGSRPFLVAFPFSNDSKDAELGQTGPQPVAKGLPPGGAQNTQ